MQSPPHMAIETTRELFHTIVDSGVSADLLKQTANVDLDLLQRSEYRFPVDSHLSLWHAAESFMKNAAIGVQMGAKSDPYNRGIVGLTFAASPNLEVAILNKVRYTKILADHITLEFIKNGDEFSIDYSILDGFFHRYEIERVFAGFLNWVRVFTKQEINPVGLYFQYGEPNQLVEYERHFQCPLVFDQPGNRLVFDACLLKEENPAHNDYLYNILRARAESVMVNLGSHRSFIDGLRNLIAGRLNQGCFSAEDVSSALNMSKRTFYRRLNEEEMSYQVLLDDIREKMAVSYLVDGGCSVKNIPNLLGYSGMRSFNRAFKRWTGCSTGEYIKRNKLPAPPN